MSCTFEDFNSTITIKNNDGIKINIVGSRPPPTAADINKANQNALAAIAAFKESGLQNATFKFGCTETIMSGNTNCPVTYIQSPAETSAPPLPAPTAPTATIPSTILAATLAVPLSTKAFGDTKDTKRVDGAKYKAALVAVPVALPPKPTASVVVQSPMPAALTMANAQEAAKFVKQQLASGNPASYGSSFTYIGGAGGSYGFGDNSNSNVTITRYTDCGKNNHTHISAGGNPWRSISVSNGSTTFGSADGKAAQVHENDESAVSNSSSTPRVKSCTVCEFTFRDRDVFCSLCGTRRSYETNAAANAATNATASLTRAAGVTNTVATSIPAATVALAAAEPTEDGGDDRPE